MSQTPISSKQVAQLIKKNTKKVITESGIDPSTRSGSKELDHLVKRLANQPFPSLAAAETFGEALGQKIVALSQQLGKQNLDRGVIWQLVVKKDFPTIGEGISSQSQKTPQTPAKPSVAAQPPIVEKPVEEPVEELTAEEEPIAEEPIAEEPEVGEDPPVEAVDEPVVAIEEEEEDEPVTAVAEVEAEDEPETEETEEEEEEEDEEEEEEEEEEEPVAAVAEAEDNELEQPGEVAKEKIKKA